MRTQGTGNSVRQRVTRVLAAGALLFMYAFGMVATTGAFVAASVSPAFAQRGRGGGWGEAGAAAGAEGRHGVGAAVGIGVGAAIIGVAYRVQRRRRAAAAGGRQLLHAALSFVRSQ